MRDDEAGERGSNRHWLSSLPIKYVVLHELGSYSFAFLLEG